MVRGEEGRIRVSPNHPPTHVNLTNCIAPSPLLNRIPKSWPNWESKRLHPVLVARALPAERWRRFISLPAPRTRSWQWCSRRWMCSPFREPKKSTCSRRTAPFCTLPPPKVSNNWMNDGFWVGCAGWMWVGGESGLSRQSWMMDGWLNGNE